MQERIEILVVDRVPTSIAQKLDQIAKKSFTAAAGLRELSRATAVVRPALLSTGDLARPVVAQFTDLSRASATLASVLKGVAPLLAKHATTTTSAAKANDALAASATRTAAAYRASTAAVQANSSALTANTAAAALPGMGGLRQPSTYGNPLGVTAQEAKALAGGVNTASSALNGYAVAAGTAQKASLSLGAALRTMFLVYFAAAAADRILTIADAYTELTNKLIIVEGTAEAAADKLRNLAALANRTRTAIEPTVKLYQRVSLAMQHMNVTGEEVEAVVRNVNAAMVASGADTQETTAALRQLSQSFSKGKSDGDEFRSMMENAGLLMDLVAAEMGVFRHELVALAPQGKITADIMFRAFSRGDEALEKLDLTTVTLGHSLERLKTNFTLAFGELNTSLKATERLAVELGALADHADKISVALGLLATAGIGKLLWMLGTWLAGAVTTIAGTAAGAAAIMTGLVYLAAKAGSEVGHMFARIQREIDGTAEAARRYESRMQALQFETDLATGKIAKQIAAAREADLQARIAVRKRKLLVDLHGKDGADAYLFEQGQIDLLLSQKKSVEELVKAEREEAYVAELTKAAKSGQLKMTDQLAAAIARLATRMADQAALESALVSGYMSHQGALESAIVEQESLEALYNETGLPGYARALKAATDEVARLRRELTMTDDELAAYNANVARNTALENARNEVLSKTVDARQHLTDLVETTKKMRDAGEIVPEDAVRLLAEYQAQLDRLNGVTNEQTAAEKALANARATHEGSLEDAILAQESLAELLEQTGLPGYARALAVATEEVERLRRELNMTDDQLAEYNASVARNEAIDQILASVQSTRAALEVEEAALHTLFYSGALNTDAYTQSLAGIRAEMLALRMETEKYTNGMTALGDVLELVMLDYIARAGNTLQNMADIGVQSLDALTQGTGDLVAQWVVFGEKMDFADLFREIIRQMISALVALAAQLLIVGILRQWAGLQPGPVQGPPSPGGLPTSFSDPFGNPMTGNSVEMFASGGYTGDMAKTDVAGLVHGQEFVVNARATAKNRAVLEAMNSGKGIVPSVVINNNAPGVTVRAESISESEVRLIAEETVMKQAGRVVASELRNANSPVSKSLRQNTTASTKGV